MATSTQLLLDLLVDGQNQAEIPVNEAFQAFDAIIQLSVKDRDLTAPPGSPTEGDRYLIATSATGAWSGHDGELTVYLNGSWVFWTLREGWQFWVDDENKLFVYNGSGLTEITLGQTHTMLVKGPTASEDRTLFFTEKAITVRKFAGVLITAVGTPSVTVILRHDTSRNAAGTQIISVAVTSVTTGTISTTFDDATIPANSWVWLETSASNLGASDELHVSVLWTED